MFISHSLRPEPNNTHIAFQSLTFHGRGRRIKLRSNVIVSDDRWELWVLGTSILRLHQGWIRRGTPCGRALVRYRSYICPISYVPPLFRPFSFDFIHLLFVLFLLTMSIIRLHLMLVSLFLGNFEFLVNLLILRCILSLVIKLRTKLVKPKKKNEISSHHLCPPNLLATKSEQRSGSFSCLSPLVRFTRNFWVGPT